MSVSFVSIENVRCIEQAKLDLPSGHTLIWGPNGSGKTSVLESLFLLGRGRSFRTRNTERVIRQGADQLTVFGRTTGAERSIGIQAIRGKPTLARVGGAPVSGFAALSEAFPVQIIDPGVHKLIEEGGLRRRRWMDWLVFHVEQNFLDIWSRYHRTLRQRNAALRSAAEPMLAWDAELAELGEALSRARRKTLERLVPFWDETARSLLPSEVTLTYVQGWAKDRTLAEALQESRVRDRIRGITHVGPHRADIQVRVRGILARDIASRGQQKLIAIALILAQLHMVRAELEAVPTLMLDDPAAELDTAHLEAFIDRVESLKCQLICTSLERSPKAFDAPDQRFHVEQGRVEPV